MNIIEQVGADYFSSRFQGCIFIGPDNAPHYVEGVTTQRSGVVQCKKVENYKSVVNANIPFDFFESFSFLAVPEVGWRATEGGRVLVNFTRNNSSYTRGITLKNLWRTYADHTEYMFHMGKLKKADFELPSYVTMQVTKPEHTPMSDGLAAMNSGKIVGFTNSARIAVVPESNSVYNIYCDHAHVANISPEGEISVLEGCEDFEPEILQ